MAKQATAIGFGSSDAWAFGPGTRPVSPEPLPVVESEPAVENPPVMEGPRSNGGGDYERPAVFLFEPSEPPPAERNMWDQLPAERRRRSRRYVGKHRA